MPDRAYRAAAAVGWRDRILAHPFQLATATLSIACAVLLIAGQVWPAFDPSPSLAEAERWIGYAVAVVWLAGGPLVHYSYWSRRLSLGVALMYERIGALLLAAGWLSYSLAVIAVRPNSVISWLVSLALGCAFVARWWAIGVRMRLDRQTQRTLREAA